jgi:hypothetical protein
MPIPSSPGRPCRRRPACYSPPGTDRGTARTGTATSVQGTCADSTAAVTCTAYAVDNGQAGAAHRPPCMSGDESVRPLGRRSSVRTFDRRLRPFYELCLGKIDRRRTFGVSCCFLGRWMDAPSLSSVCGGSDHEWK